MGNVPGRPEAPQGPTRQDRASANNLGTRASRAKAGFARAEDFSPLRHLRQRELHGVGGAQPTAWLPSTNFAELSRDSHQMARQIRSLARIVTDRKETQHSAAETLSGLQQLLGDASEGDTLVHRARAFIQLGGMEAVMELLHYLLGRVDAISKELQAGANAARVSVLQSQHTAIFGVIGFAVVLLREVVYSVGTLTAQRGGNTPSHWMSTDATFAALLNLARIPSVASPALYTIEEMLVGRGPTMTAEGLARHGCDLPLVLMRFGPKELAASTRLLSFLLFDANVQDPLAPPSAETMVRRSAETMTHWPEAGAGAAGSAAPAEAADECPTARLPRLYATSTTPAVDEMQCATMLPGDGVLLHRLLMMAAAPDPGPGFGRLLRAARNAGFTGVGMEAAMALDEDAEEEEEEESDEGTDSDGSDDEDDEDDDEDDEEDEDDEGGDGEGEEADYAEDDDEYYDEEEGYPSAFDDQILSAAAAAIGSPGGVAGLTAALNHAGLDPRALADLLTLPGSDGAMSDLFVQTMIAQLRDGRGPAGAAAGGRGPAAATGGGGATGERAELNRFFDMLDAVTNEMSFLSPTEYNNPELDSAEVLATAPTPAAPAAEAPQQPRLPPPPPVAGSAAPVASAPAAPLAASAMPALPPSGTASPASFVSFESATHPADQDGEDGSGDDSSLPDLEPRGIDQRDIERSLAAVAAAAVAAAAGEGGGEGDEEGEVEVSTGTIAVDENGRVVFVGGDVAAVQAFDSYLQAAGGAGGAAAPAPLAADGTPQLSDFARDAIMAAVAMNAAGGGEAAAVLSPTAMETNEGGISALPVAAAATNGPAVKAAEAAPGASAQSEDAPAADVGYEPGWITGLGSRCPKARFAEAEGLPAPPLMDPSQRLLGTAFSGPAPIDWIQLGQLLTEMGASPRLGGWTGLTKQQSELPSPAGRSAGSTWALDVPGSMSFAFLDTNRLAFDRHSRRHLVRVVAAAPASAGAEAAAPASATAAPAPAPAPSSTPPSSSSSNPIFSLADCVDETTGQQVLPSRSGGGATAVSFTPATQAAAASAPQRRHPTSGAAGPTPVPALTAGNRMRAQLTVHSMKPHRPTVWATLSAMMGGVRRRQVQDYAAAHGFLPSLAAIVRKINFAYTPGSKPPPRIHGPTCECRPETTLNSTILRTLYAFLDRETESPVTRWFSRRRFLTQAELQRVFTVYGRPGKVPYCEIEDPPAPGYVPVNEATVLLEGVRLAACRPWAWVSPFAVASAAGPSEACTPVVVSRDDAALKAWLAGAAYAPWASTIPSATFEPEAQLLQLPQEASPTPASSSLQLYLSDPVFVGRNTAGVKPFSVDDIDDDLEDAATAASLPPLVVKGADEAAKHAFPAPDPELLIDSVANHPLPMKRSEASKSRARHITVLGGIALGGNYPLSAAAWAQDRDTYSSKYVKYGMGVVANLAWGLSNAGTGCSYRSWAMSCLAAFVREAPSPARRWIAGHGLMRSFVYSLLSEHAATGFRYQHGGFEPEATTWTPPASAAPAAPTPAIPVVGGGRSPRPAGPDRGPEPPFWRRILNAHEALWSEADKDKKKKKKGAAAAVEAVGGAADADGEAAEEEEEEEEEGFAARYSLQSGFDVLGELVRRDAALLTELADADAYWTLVVMPGLAKEGGSIASAWRSALGHDEPGTPFVSEVSAHYRGPQDQELPQIWGVDCPFTLLRLAFDRIVDSNVFLRNMYLTEDWAMGLTRAEAGISLDPAPPGPPRANCYPYVDTDDSPAARAAVVAHPWSWESLHAATAAALTAAPAPTAALAGGLYPVQDWSILCSPLISKLRDVRIPFMHALLHSVSVKTLSMDNLCCINTFICMCVMAHRHGALPGLFAELSRHTEAAAAAAGADVCDEADGPSVASRAGASSGGLLDTDTAATTEALYNVLMGAATANGAEAPSLSAAAGGATPADVAAPVGRLPSLGDACCGLPAGAPVPGAKKPLVLTPQAMGQRLRKLLCFWLVYYSLRDRDRRSLRAYSMYHYPEWRAVVWALLGHPVAKDGVNVPSLATTPPITLGGVPMLAFHPWYTPTAPTLAASLKEAEDAMHREVAAGEEAVMAGWVVEPFPGYWAACKFAC